ncbi:sugar ABC transporter substrate-binding protein [Kribbella sandramycini]|uniref:Multiple sugar transport system substrate-binding protein n=1 Tax=Kribbella sandramycini TaxID=60450 RepID=A0A7Y4KYE7_9ACTN|nr:sugar ABC transporter substrate-binding protein [Kribbella sandramycini]MBB6569211.1 multiple sugar transport system substrate-binding protein [Kribbella sandramycini]NOL40948.1 sugar ABC transporter substrate-binding protein [Kribbella sandramycini]
MATKIKWVAVGIGVTLAVAACGASGPAKVEQDAGAPLELWTRTTPGGDGEKGMKKLAAAFEKATGTKIEVTAIFDDFETKLSQRAAQKDLPDIVMNDSSQLGTMVTQGIVREVDLAKITGSDQLLESALAAAKFSDGKTYGVPYSAQASALMIRKDWRAKVGLPAPADLTQFVALAKAFTTQDPDGNGKNDTFGLAVPGSTKRGYASWYFSNFLWAAGGDFVAKQPDGKYKPAMSTPESVAATKWFRDLACTEKVVQPGAATMDTPPTNETFESGRAGMYVVGPYLMPRFDASLGKDKYEVVPVPKGVKDSTVLAEGGSAYLMAGSKNEAGQNAWASWIISPDAQKLGMEGEKAFNVQLPVNKNVDVSAVRSDPRWKVYAEVYRDHSRYAPSIPNWTPVRQASADTINALIADCGLDVAAELTKLDGKLADALKQQGISAS